MKYNCGSSEINPRIHEAATSLLSPIMELNIKKLIEAFWTSVIAKSIYDS